MKKIYTFTKMLLVSFIFIVFLENSFSNTKIPLIKFELNTSNAIEKFEFVLMNPKDYLENFIPKGIKLRDRNFQGKMLSFKATKKVLLISKTLFVSGVIDYKLGNEYCVKGENGYEISIDFQSSESLVYENLKSILLNICVENYLNKNLKVRAFGEITDGDNQFPVLNNIIKTTIVDQISPILSSFKEQVQKIKI